MYNIFLLILFASFIQNSGTGNCFTLQEWYSFCMHVWLSHVFHHSLYVQWNGKTRNHINKLRQRLEAWRQLHIFQFRFCFLHSKWINTKLPKQCTVWQYWSDFHREWRCRVTSHCYSDHHPTVPRCTTVRTSDCSGPERHKATARRVTILTQAKGTISYNTSAKHFTLKAVVLC